MIKKVVCVSKLCPSCLKVVSKMSRSCLKVSPFSRPFPHSLPISSSFPHSLSISSQPGSKAPAGCVTLLTCNRYQLRCKILRYYHIYKLIGSIHVSLFEVRKQLKSKLNLQTSCKRFPRALFSISMASRKDAPRGRLKVHQSTKQNPEAV